jgi:glycosyltransferase involved in cell wall biosynthesis
MKKVAILIARPGPTNAPLFKKLSKHPLINLTVFYFTDIGINKADYDSEFNLKINWGSGVLDGYNYKFLKSLLPKRISEKRDTWVNLGVIKEIYLGKYDAFIVYGWSAPTHWLSFIACFLTKTPIFIWSENPLQQEFLKFGFFQKIKRFVLRVLFRYVSGFLYIGEQNKKFYEFLGVKQNKLFFTPYATSNEICMERAKSLIPNNKDLRIQNGFSVNSPLILFVGKLIEKKRPLRLLRAYESILKRGNLKELPTLVFIGDGELRKELELYVKERNLKKCFFKGFQDKEGVYKYMSIADVFVLPSGMGETWGMVVNEAMCFSLPVVVSDVVGCGVDLVHSGENGYIFKLDDEEELAVNLLKIISNLEGAKQMGEKSNKIIQGYSQERDVEGIVEAVLSLEKDNN